MGVSRWVRADPWRALLMLVAACYGLVQLVAVGPGMGLGWDETVYVSQVDPRVPAAEFIAPRARGITLIVAPVTMVTSSTDVLRVYLCLLSALALYGSFGTWLRLRSGAVVPLAALLFGSLWLTLFYGNEVMPNLWVALGAVAAVGFFLRCTRPDAGRADVVEPDGGRGAGVPPDGGSGGAAGPDGGRGALVGLVVCVAAVGLLRPPDSLWLVLPLALALAWPGRRRLSVLLALVAGLVVGWADWIVEAYVRFGGLLARWHAAGAANETGLHFSLPDHAQALNGPLLCRPPGDCGPAEPSWVLWWSAIPVLVLLGLYAARRADSLLPAVVAGSLAVPYIFLVGYAAPRFLLPTYALLAFPIAHGAVGLLGRTRGRALRWAVACLVTAGFLAHLTLQAGTLGAIVAPRLAKREGDALVAKALEGLGVRPPCLVYGEQAVKIAYRMGCAGHTVLTWPGQSDPPAPVRDAAAAGQQVVAVDRGRPVPAPFLLTWERRHLPDVRPGQWSAYVPR
ncbi:hypothetical protein [Nonomuraea glycinis]|uniref:hypothetical protein n=1 Tax=Nonomuraea glycinis TaxID=2047744 RepID=UPI0033A851D8